MITKKGKKIMKAMKEKYGSKKRRASLLCF